MSLIKGWKFPVEVDKKTGKIETVEDNNNIKQSVNIILKTELMERKILKNFGTSLRPFMFGIVNPNYINSIKKSITTALETWEDNIKILEINVNSSQGIVTKVEVEITYMTNFDIMPETFTRVIN